MLPCLFSPKKIRKEKGLTVVYLQGREAFIEAKYKTLQLPTQTTEIRNTGNKHQMHSCANQALNPLRRLLQGLDGTFAQACFAASSICSILTPALHILAKERMCFIPYCEIEPQCVSNVLTCIFKIARK